MGICRGTISPSECVVNFSLMSCCDFWYFGHYAQFETMRSCELRFGVDG